MSYFILPHCMRERKSQISGQFLWREVIEERNKDHFVTPLIHKPVNRFIPYNSYQLESSDTDAGRY